MTTYSPKAISYAEEVANNSGHSTSSDNWTRIYQAVLLGYTRGHADGEEDASKIDYSSDNAIAIGEHAFRAGWEACGKSLLPDFPKEVHQAWDDYEPTEELKGLDV